MLLLVNNYLLTHNLQIMNIRVTMVGTTMPLILNGAELTCQWKGEPR